MKIVILRILILLGIAGVFLIFSWGTRYERDLLNPAAVMEEMVPVHELPAMEELFCQEKNCPNNKPVFEIPDGMPESSFVLADLKAMMIMTVDREKEIIKTYPVLSFRDFGKFKTPTGNFTALMKEEKHFSSIGRVWMPWSIQFSGDYFIHGWPYYPDGTQVPQGYSGGCVRLATKDAEELYTFIKVGTPIIVVK